jgi:hypothetical protein
MMRMMLYEAAQTMLVVSTKWSWLGAWANEDRQKPRDEKGDRGAGASARRHHAPHMD